MRRRLCEGNRVSKLEQDTDHALIVARLVQRILCYAAARAGNVASGAVTPELAALLLQRYGRGIIDTVIDVYGCPRVVAKLFRVLDEETTRIDPLWIEHEGLVWVGHRAEDVYLG